MTGNAPREVSLWAALLLLACAATANADLVVMQNSDRYNGKVLSVTTNALVLQSEILGTVTLPRAKVSSISLGSAAATDPSPPATIIPSHGSSVLKTNGTSELSAQFRQLGTQTNLMRQVQSQFLAAAGPEANATFNRLLNDLSTGKMDINGLRVQAQSAAAQLRSLEQEAGADDTGTFKMYLSVLESFLKETEPSTNATSLLPGSKPATVQREE